MLHVLLGGENNLCINVAQDRVVRREIECMLLSEKKKLSSPVSWNCPLDQRHTCQYCKLDIWIYVSYDTVLASANCPSKQYSRWDICRIYARTHFRSPSVCLNIQNIGIYT